MNLTPIKQTWNPPVTMSTSAPSPTRRPPATCGTEGHTWEWDYTHGDTCACGAFYLDRTMDGRMRVSERVP